MSEARAERLVGWGRAIGSECRVARPASADEVKQWFRRARAAGWKVAFRGGGCSYGDAALNSGNLVLDLTAMDAILGFDEREGIVHAEPGVTIEKLWRTALPRGWWPPVVPGTMFVTLGGAASANIHGKNNWQAGPIGEHLVELDLLLPDGSSVRCRPGENGDLFHAAVGGFGMLGCITSVKLRMKRVHSGDLFVRPEACSSIRGMTKSLEAGLDRWDYQVGWVDAFKRGASAGRGLIHRACYLRPGEDEDPARTLSGDHQDLPSRFFGVVPRTWMRRLLRPFMNDRGMRMINSLKYAAGKREAARSRGRRQALAAFSFLLDYVPDWKLAYGKGGLIQHQSFIPGSTAAEVISEMLSTERRRGLSPYLGVLKRHRPDRFLMSHAVDGYSLAQDFRVTARNRERLWALCHELDEIVLLAKGRFYFAKDGTMEASSLLRAYPEANVRAFLELKRRLDPDGLLESDLFRRVFAEARQG